MIIEDDPDIREGVRILLESENYEVREAPDGAKGLAALEESTDLVILDVMMRGCQGCVPAGRSARGRMSRCFF